jgi:hypothetical protein
MGIRRRTVIFENSYVTNSEYGTAAGNIHDFNALMRRRIDPPKYLATERCATTRIACDHAAQGG